MNKGIIMEVKPNYAIIMNESGCMEKIVRKKNMNIGQKIFYFDEDVIKINNIIKFNNSSFIRAMSSIAAIILIVFTVFYQTAYKQEAYAVVSLDINPSIQIEVDSQKNIIGAKGMNDDGKRLDYDDIKGLDINTGIEKIKQQLVEKNYLKNNKDVLVAFALVNKEDDESYEKSVKGAIKSTFDSEDISVTFVKGNKEDIDKAETKGISLGRYEAAQKVDKDKVVNINKAPVKEITELIKDKDGVDHWGKDTGNGNVKVEGSVVVDEPADSAENKKHETTASDNKNNSSSSNNNTSTGSSTNNKPVVNESGNKIHNNASGNENSGNKIPDKQKDEDVIEVKPDPKPEGTEVEDGNKNGNTSSDGKNETEINGSEENGSSSKDESKTEGASPELKTK